MTTLGIQISRRVIIFQLATKAQGFGSRLLVPPQPHSLAQAEEALALIAAEDEALEATRAALAESLRLKNKLEASEASYNPFTRSRRLNSPF